jgi:hypothetical protein
MRLRTASKYIIMDMKNAVLIFYLIVFLGTVFFSVSISGTNSGNSTLSGIEMASIIFLFILGLNSFKKNYQFLLSNGISRKTQFCSFLLSALTVAAFMAAMDTIISNALSYLIDFKYVSMFNQMYDRFGQGPAKVLVTFIWSTVFYLFAVMLGYFITTAYYRMFKVLKIIISISVPVFFTSIFPIIDYKYFDQRVSKWVVDAATAALGLKGGCRPMTGVLTFLILGVVFSALSFLMLRRAPLKEN